MTEEGKAPLTEESAESKNFILNFIDEDIAEGGRFQGLTVHTRFPPEPNGYLHIGHCKALCIDFGTAERYGGLCNLRMDDTNPAKEDTEYVDAIQQDIHWLGFDWGDRFFYGSDYFEKDYEYAVELIKKGLAYVCELTPEEFKANRGDIGIPATSPYRDRPIEENLRLFEKMKNGQQKRIICRYTEFNILRDSVQTTNNSAYWQTNPDIMDVTDTYGTFTASFNTSVNGGGAMYQYYGSKAVPAGWLVPLTYINIGRQINADEEIAKVRLIVPHSQGHSDASSNVYPCFYEITYQEMRN